MNALLNSVSAGFLLGGLLALTALGLSLVLGVLRLVNLAHGEFLVVGAYGGFYLATLGGIDPLLGLPLVALGAAVVAIPLYRYLLEPVSARTAEAPMMTTFGISVVLQNLFLSAFSADTRSIETTYSAASVSLGPVTLPRMYLVSFLWSVLIVGVVHALVRHSAFGRALRASAQDPAAAAIIGVNVPRVRSLTFALGAACAAVGGVLSALSFSFTPASGATFLLNSFAVVVLGGLGNVAGTLYAGLLIGVLQSVGGSVLGDGYRDAVALAVFLVALVLRPQGFGGRR